MRAQDAVGPVRRAVRLVPPGRVVTYGDVAGLVGCGPRLVGAILRDHGDGLPWWRVVRADGSFVAPDGARPHWEHEGIPRRPDGRGVRISVCRADLVAWATEFQLDDPFG